MSGNGRPQLRREGSKKSLSSSSGGASDSEMPQASTSSLPLDESVSTLQPPSPKAKKRRTSRESSNASAAGGSEGSSPTGSFLSRFISSFRSGQDIRPSLSRSISTPHNRTSPRLGDPPSPTDTQPGHSSAASGTTGRFRPPFARRGGSETTKSSRSVSPAHTPPNESSDPIDNLNARLLKGTDRSVDMVKRGSMTSQRTVQPRKFSHTTSPLASPTLQSPKASSALNDPIARHDYASGSHSQHTDELQSALTILSELIPPALLLLAYIGPNHLFAPQLSAAISEALSATSPMSSNPYSQTSSRAWDSTSAASAASNTSLPSMFQPPSLGPTHSHELHSSSALSLPALTASALWKLLRGFEWLSNWRTASAALDATYHDTSPDFDFPSLLQSAIDVLAAEAASRSVEVLIGQGGPTGSSSPFSRPAHSPVKKMQEADGEHVETRELLVMADERQWMVVLVYMIRQIIMNCATSSTIEIRFSAKQTSHGLVTGDKVVAGDSQDTYVPTRASLRKEWRVMLDVAVFDNTSSISNASTPMSPNAPFGSKASRTLCSQVDMNISPRVVDDASSAWRWEATLPGSLLPANESPSDLLGKRRASLETANHEPTTEELKRFADGGLKGVKVSLHAAELSVFARHVTAYLALWGMEVTHIPVDKDDDASSTTGSMSGGDTYWNKGKREPVSRLDSGFASAGLAEPASTNYEPANSPLRSSSSDTGSNQTSPDACTSGVAIVDDDVATLRRLLYALKPPVIHAAPLLAKRPVFASRRTRSSPHVRQVHHSAQPTPGWPIIYFTSLSHYKAVKEVIAETIAISKSAPLPEVIIVPKPAGPRRTLTSLWTALKRPAVDPLLPPIATAPTSPGVQYWAPPRLSPSVNGAQEFDFPSGEGLSRHDSISPKPRTPPTASQATFSPSPYPPSPLGKVPDEQASYFSDVAESIEGVSPSEGVVVQSPDGRPAIYFQPQKKSHRSSSSREKNREKERSKLNESDVEAKADASTSGDRTERPSSPVGQQTTVTAPHEIGLGHARRSSGSAASSPRGEGPAGTGSNVPLATPALSLDAFINFAKGSRNEAEAEVEAPTSLARHDSSLSRHTSSSSAPSAPGVSSAHSSRANSERASQSNSPRPSMFGHPRRTASGANSPPASPRLAAIDTSGVSSGTSRGASSNITPGANRKMSFGAAKRAKRKNSLMPTVPPINVLIVEDNPINQTILSMFMKKKGIKYAVAKDGEEAVQKWKNGDFHLVLMDIQLPVKDGITATREIRELEKQKNVGTFVTTPESTTPASSTSTSPSPLSPTSPQLSMPVIIVALTASSLNEDRVTALAAGCNDFLTKPVSLPWLQQKLLEWGSMAYLSGFSKRLRGDSVGNGSPSRPRPTAGFKKTAALQAQSISEHLHIDPNRPHGHGKSANLPVNNVTSADPPGSQGPQIVFQEPTPEVTPANAQKETKAKDLETEAKHEAAVAQRQRGPNLDLVDAKLSDLKAQADGSIGSDLPSAKTPPRPPPVPLVQKDHSRPSPESQPSLESVLNEGDRLTRAGQSRHADSSFAQVMTDSFTDAQP